MKAKKAKVILCKCGSGKPATIKGFSKSGKLVLTRCVKCEPSVSDNRSIQAITR